MADLGTIVSKVTTITTSWFQDVNNSVYRAGTTPTQIDVAHHAAPSKTTPVDADEVAIADSASSFAFARLTFLNLRNQLFTLFGAMIAAATGKTVPVGGDFMVLADSAAGNATKQVSLTNLFGNFGAPTIYATIGPQINTTTAKATPVGADKMLLADSAASFANKSVTMSALFNSIQLGSSLASGVTGTTQAVNDNSTKIATTAYVDARAPTLLAPIATTSGTVVTQTGIPSWVKRITFNLKGVGTNGTAVKLLQVGSGSLTVTGYLGSSGGIAGSAAASAVQTAGLGIQSGAAADRMNGSIILTLENASTNSWCAAGMVSMSNSAAILLVAGSISLTGALDRVAITTANGTDAFVAGEISVVYE